MTQKGTYNTDDYRKAEKALTESLNRQLNENRRYWQQLEVVQGTGKRSPACISDFTVDADNTAEQAEQVFSSAFSNMGNGLATFVPTTANSTSNPSPLRCCQIWRNILAQGNHDEIDFKRDLAVGTGDLNSQQPLSLNANGGFISLLDLIRYSAHGG